MKKDEFDKVPVKKYFVTDSDGTVAPFVQLKDKEKAIPTKQFLEKIRQLSFDNPDLAVVILSGRKNGELNRFYRDAMAPNKDGIHPKIALASENGAFIQVRPINDVDVEKEIISETHDDMHQMAEPLSDELKEKIEQIFINAAGNHYTNNTNDDSEEKWVRAEVKKYGFTAHYEEPKNEKDKIAFKKAIEQIKEGLTEFGKENNMHVHLGAAKAFTIELVSKGLIITRLADNDKNLSGLFKKNGWTTEKPDFMSYSGDDVGDHPALSELNKRFTENTLEGYTSRPNNYSPHDPEGRTSNDPKDLSIRDSFFILGTNEKLAQDMHRDNFASVEAANKLNELRKSLSKAELLPSQNEAQSVPPIVLLSSGDILLQNPELYPQKKLENLNSWTTGKVVLMANETGESKTVLEKLANKNDKLTVINTEGQLYSKGTGTYTTLGEGLANAKEENKIISANPDRANEVQFLRAIQTLIVKNEQQQQGTATDLAALASTSTAVRPTQRKVLGSDTKPKATPSKKPKRS